MYSYSGGRRPRLMIIHWGDSVPFQTRVSLEGILRSREGMLRAIGCSFVLATSHDVYEPLVAWLNEDARVLYLRVGRRWEDLASAERERQFLEAVIPVLADFASKPLVELHFACLESTCGDAGLDLRELARVTKRFSQYLVRATSSPFQEPGGAAAARERRG